MSVADFLKRLQADAAAGAPVNLKQIRNEIHDLHDKSVTTQERVALLSVHKSLLGVAERQMRLDDLAEYRNLHRADYNLLLIKEATIGDNSGNINPHRMAVITNREVAAGRMSPDDELHKLAAAGSFIFGSRPKPYTLADFSFKRLFSRREKAMSDKRCMYIIQKKAPGPVTPDECCEKSAVEQEADTGRWYCREHFDRRRSGDVPAKSNGEGHTFSFQTS